MCVCEWVRMECRSRTFCFRFTSTAFKVVNDVMLLKRDMQKTKHDFLRKLNSSLQGGNFHHAPESRHDGDAGGMKWQLDVDHSRIPLALIHLPAGFCLSRSARNSASSPRLGSCAAQRFQDGSSGCRHDVSEGCWYLGRETGLWAQALWVSCPQGCCSDFISQQALSHSFSYKENKALTPDSAFLLGKWCMGTFSSCRFSL